MRRHVHLVIVLSPIAFAVGCPSTSTTPPSIELVRVIDGEARNGDFSLEINGRGFATELSYDLSSQSGTARAELRVEVYDALELTRVPAVPGSVQVMSPQKIIADVVDALEPGVWGVRIYNGDKVLAQKDEAFDVDGVIIPDAGIPPDDDAGVPPDSGVPPPDGGELPDAGEDAGLPDTGEPPDSGLGEFVGQFQYRQVVSVTNPTALDAPIDTTILIPVRHAMMLAAMQAKADASDIALYLGATELKYQWDDRVKIGTDELVMVAKLPAAIPPGVYTGPPLVLYFGDPMASIIPDDTVFAFAERFDGNFNGWFINAELDNCGYNRPSEIDIPLLQTAVCFPDGGNEPTRRTLASPPTAAISTTGIAMNQRYELSMWTSGLMEEPAEDLFYFSTNNVSNRFDNTTLIPLIQWAGFLPNIPAFTFEEQDTNQDRTVEGWSYGTTFEWWKRSTARFTTNYTSTSLHFRFVSKDGDNNNDTKVVLDDVTVRVALEDDFDVTLGDVERKSP